MLVNNAGTGVLEGFLELTESSYDRIMQVNLKSATFISQAFCKAFIKRHAAGNIEKGAIVNISSQASSVPLWNHTAYCISKAGMDHLTKMVALEMGSKCKMRVNSVNPTVVMTALGRSAWSDPKKAATVLDKIPLNRFAEVNEVVEPVLFLLSDAAAMIHGVSIPIDGGFCNCN